MKSLFKRYLYLLKMTLLWVSMSIALMLPLFLLGFLGNPLFLVLYIFIVPYAILIIENHT